MSEMQRPHALYRFFAEDGELLYIGITSNPARRFAQHGAGKEWWEEVAEIRMERHSSREAVLEAEKVAIIAEKPRYNVVHANGAVATTEGPKAPRGYPVTVGEVVALGIAPNHHGEASCPVGLVLEVGPLGVKLALLHWLIGTFNTERFVAWARVMEIRWAPEMDSEDARDRGWRTDQPVFDCDQLAFFQTEWTHGRERALEDRRQDEEARAKREARRMSRD